MHCAWLWLWLWFVYNSHILKFVKVGMKEIEVRNEMLRYMLSLGATKESFDIIVASGKRGAMPHGVASNKKIKNPPNNAIIIVFITFPHFSLKFLLILY